MALRLLRDARPRAAERSPARRRALPARPRAAQGCTTRYRYRSRPPRKLRPDSYRAGDALVPLSFGSREALGRLALLRLASALRALIAPLRLLMKLARLLDARGAAAGLQAQRRSEPHLSAALRKVRAT